MDTKEYVGNKKQNANVDLEWISQFKPRIMKTINLTEYDDYIYDSKNYIGGHLPKHFYRAPSSKFPDLFREIQENSNCGYVTSYNDIVKEGLIPENISVMKKSFGNFIYHPEREAIGSKLLNFMGVPTTYNAIVKHPMINNNHYEKETNEYEVLSVDLIGAYETFHPFDELRIMTFDNIFKTIEKIKKSFLKFGFDSKASRQKNCEKVIEQFVLTYMIRGYLLGDNDFCGRNLGFLYNEKTKKIRLVNFDYEQCFMADITNALRKYSEFDEPTFVYVKNNYPEVYKKFLGYVGLFKEKLANCDEKLLMQKFNRNFSEIMTCLKENADAIVDFDTMIENKIKTYGDEYLRKCELTNKTDCIKI